ncbi:MAG: orotate phosphoribosyltransferase [Deltaproteobacteria bacterium]|nr:orotate phosphoribosyltransferase [Deltaproteobacteria bacterium]MBW2170362.1 orotate phosphoribosyltransferase [Deltaproteobacteria bacterium]MBW2259179.1 orotate phosphoribosyltransferase [Deltaproteobacteria bacterium]
MKQELIEMLCEKSFMYSKEPIYRLVSGRQSHFYVNCKPTTLHPKGMFLVGHMVFDCVKEADAQGIGGLTFGADPVALAAAFVSYLKEKPLRAFSIRKTQKDHGIVKWLEGDMQPGEKVVIVEDVVTTGGSTIKAVERARAEGLEVVKVVVLVDREEGGMEAVKAHVDSIEAIVTVADLMAVYQKREVVSNT